MLLPRQMLAGAALAALALAGCGGDDPVAPPGPASAIILSGGGGVIGVGDTVRLSALVVDAAGRRVPDAVITWRSLAPEVVLAEEGGLVRGWEGGEGAVVAELGTLADTVFFRVELLPRRLTFAGTSSDSIWMLSPSEFTVRLLDGRGRPVASPAPQFAASDSTRLWVVRPSASDSLRVRLVGLLPGVDTLVATVGDVRLTRAVRTRLAAAPMQGLRVATGALGPVHACALDPAGAASCWGQNDYGQLGGGVRSTTTTYQPVVAVTGGHRFTRLAASTGSTCGISSAKRLLCWGYDIAGAFDATPRAMFDGTDVTHLALGSGAGPCVITATSAVFCWRFRTTTPDPWGFASDPGTLSDISGNWEYLCVLSSEGRVWCGGGPGTFLSPLPDSYPRLTRIAASSPAIARFGCGLTASGEAWCWGDNRYGQLGRASQRAPGDTTSLPPGAVATAARFTSIVVGRTLACGLTAAGEILCWGGSPASSSNSAYVPIALYRVPVRLLGDDRFTALLGGLDRTPCGVLENGDLRCIYSVPRPNP